MAFLSPVCRVGSTIDSMRDWSVSGLSKGKKNFDFLWFVFQFFDSKSIINKHKLYVLYTSLISYRMILSILNYMNILGWSKKFSFQIFNIFFFFVLKFKFSHIILQDVLRAALTLAYIEKWRSFRESYRILVHRDAHRIVEDVAVQKNGKENYEIKKRYNSRKEPKTKNKARN